MRKSAGYPGELAKKFTTRDQPGDVVGIRRGLGDLIDVGHDLVYDYGSKGRASKTSNEKRLGEIQFVRGSRACKNLRM